MPKIATFSLSEVVARDLRNHFETNDKGMITCWAAKLGMDYGRLLKICSGDECGIGNFNDLIGKLREHNLHSLAASVENELDCAREFHRNRTKNTPEVANCGVGHIQFIDTCLGLNEADIFATPGAIAIGSFPVTSRPETSNSECSVAEIQFADEHSSRRVLTHFPGWPDVVDTKASPLPNTVQPQSGGPVADCSIILALIDDGHAEAIPLPESVQVVSTVPTASEDTVDSQENLSATKNYSSAGRPLLNNRPDIVPIFSPLPIAIAFIAASINGSISLNYGDGKISWAPGQEAFLLQVVQFTSTSLAALVSLRVLISVESRIRWICILGLYLYAAFATGLHCGLLFKNVPLAIFPALKSVANANATFWHTLFFVFLGHTACRLAAIIHSDNADSQRLRSIPHPYLRYMVLQLTTMWKNRQHLLEVVRARFFFWPNQWKYFSRNCQKVVNKLLRVLDVKAEHCAILYDSG